MMVVAEPDVRQALREMSPRMPGADHEALTPAVTQAWNAHPGNGRPRHVSAVTAVVAGVAWPAGYRAGVAYGHGFVANYVASAVAQQLHDPSRYDPAGQRVLRATAGSAAAVASLSPTVRDEGPSRTDYLTVLGDANWQTPAQYAAIACRVGWTHGLRAGVEDAAWSAVARILSTVDDLVGADTVRTAVIDELSGQDWLVRVDVVSRSAVMDGLDAAMRRGGAIPLAGPGQAFPALRAVDSRRPQSAAATATDAPQWTARRAQAPMNTHTAANVRNQIAGTGLRARRAEHRGHRPVPAPGPARRGGWS